MSSLPKLHLTNGPSLEEVSTEFAVSPAFSSHFIPQNSHVLTLPDADAQQSGELTAAVLAANHAKYHCFFNEKRFHNHIVHHVLALYSLGASANVIKTCFNREALDQRPIVETKNETIDHTNWSSHLGKEEYYKNYLTFFHGEIEKKGAIDVVEEFIFRHQTGDMLSRSFAGLLHPLIHWGYGLEFKINHIVAEGLAITAVHTLTMEGLKITDLLNSRSHTGLMSKILHKDTPPAGSPWLDWGSVPSSQTFRPKAGLTAFEIIAKIAQDPALSGSKKMAIPPGNPFSRAASSEELSKWLDLWEIDHDCEWTEILERTREIIWMVTVLYMTTYDSEKSEFILSFAIMHLVTASIFLPVALPLISAPFRPILLKAFVKVAMAVWLAVGRPELRITDCMENELSSKLPEAQNPIEGENPWFKVMSCAARHPDEHTTKIVRTFAFASKFYRNTRRGYYSCELKGSELLDSTIFLRAAIMTLNKQDWERSESSAKAMKWF